MASKMSDVTLTPVDPTPDDVQYLEDRIYEFNSSVTGIGDGAFRAFFVRAGERIAARHGLPPRPLAEHQFAGRPGDIRPAVVELAAANGEVAVDEVPDRQADLAEASGHPESFVGFHPFNPVPRMQLVELSFPPQASEDTRERARKLCEALGKTPVEVPDIPGFVVNRLLFPYLFSAVELLAETGMEPEAIDNCMTLGAGMPMGPIALLDYVGLDVSKAIGESIGVPVPARLVELVDAGALGRKTGQGFYAYD